MNKFNPPVSDIALVVADLDDTLADRNSNQLYPHVKSWLEQNIEGETGPHFAVASNRGGPPCRDAGWSWSWKFPTFDSDEKRILEFKKQLGCDTLFLTACSYLTKKGRARINEAKEKREDLRAVYKQLAVELQFLIPNALSYSDPRCDPFRRKPHGGMIRQAMKHFGISDPRRVLMIGDSDDDVGAAAEIGCRFHRVSEGVSIR